jgi:hypothetical protein
MGTPRRWLSVVFRARALALRPSAERRRSAGCRVWHTVSGPRGQAACVDVSPASNRAVARSLAAHRHRRLSARRVVRPSARPTGARHCLRRRLHLPSLRRCNRPSARRPVRVRDLSRLAVTRTAAPRAGNRPHRAARGSRTHTPRAGRNYPHRARVRGLAARWPSRTVDTPGLGRPMAASRRTLTGIQTTHGRSAPPTDHDSRVDYTVGRTETNNMLRKPRRMDGVWSK